MSNRPITLALLLSAVVASGSAWAAGPQKGLVPGFLDAKSGAFVTSAVPTVAPNLDAMVLATFGGTMSLKYVITLKSAIPADWKIHCMQIVTVVDTGGLTFQNSKTALATRNGNTASCLVNINYSWLLTGTEGSVHTMYSVQAEGTPAVVEDIMANGNLSVIGVPANGATTSRTVNVTL
jgi:hypothetical protein